MTAPALLEQPAPDTGDDAYHRKLVGFFTEAEEASRPAREKAERDRDYYDNKQLTEAEHAALTSRGQPPVTLNLIRQRVEYLSGLEKKQRGDPKGYPRNPEDQQAADAFTDAMRYVADRADYQSGRSAAWKNIIVEGVGGVEWSAVAIGNDVRIDQTPIPWDRIFYDPHSAKPDFSDARYLGQVFWLDEDEALERVAANGGDVEAAKALLETVFSTQGISDTFEDKPRQAVWFDKQRRRVRIVSMWHKEQGAWKLCEFTKAGKLWEMDGPYFMKDGEDLESYCPLVLESAYVDRDNNRYGIVRDLIDPQDEENKRRSKALHLLNTTGVIADSTAVESVAATRKELSRPDFYVEVSPNSKFEIVRHTELASGHMAMAAQAREYINRAGANNALQGRTDPGQSGKAIEAQQMGGLIELGDLLDNLRRFDRRSYRIIAAMIQQFWSAEKWIRVTDDELAPEYVGINVPIYYDPMSHMTGTRQEWEEVMEQAEDNGMQAPQLQPAMNDDGTPMMKNAVAELDMDIIVAEAPDTINNAGEAYQAMAQMFGMNPPPPPPIMRMMIKANPALTTRMKKEALDIVEQMTSQPNPMQELQAEGAKAGIEKTKAEGFRAMAQGEVAAMRAHQPQPMAMPADAGMMA